MFADIEVQELSCVVFWFSASPTTLRADCGAKADFMQVVSNSSFYPSVIDRMTIAH
jgi:hypothetical protein